MFKRIAPFAALSLLSGCALTNGDEYHQATLSAIQSSEANMTQKMTNLESQMGLQNDYIESLEKQITELKTQVSQIKLPPPPAPKRVSTTKPSNDQNTAISKPRHDVVLGEIESVTIDAIKQTFDARIDTGAATSSLNAVDIEEFERNGKNWVRFHLADEKNPKTEANWIEAPVLRYVRIRQSTNDNTERRAVVELWVKLGSIHEKAQFTLADRSQMTHPVLLGREFIRDIALVDVSRKYIQTEQK
ncbi:ATP-dependent Zn protease [Vibrio cholerae]|uniref:ATP-dependent zinc protease family protein n=1 Tax=Vibrio cholerae TaxID=666 RepID=UPI001159A515|nr:ATP-dependent zinc protease [Vibrio cholerae]EGR0466696.1 ATP-dependent Zn protease [Vibrio cholerae]MDQ4624139.1 ATP-dependent zinc protease [Vibrio cholerae]MDQ4697441.1 ATP-dependent zinc protease [Vibrio cholerae]TQP67260.1 ATP-dependent Zn protease [Vibrio cholerae]TQP99276.1 ATP-dependent Zn protease [Vibrio cholerae]